MGIESRTVEKEGYKTAFKATALFGGVQVVIILIQILKAKVVALWLGASGLGIMSLFNAATSLIFSISNLGLQESAVRDIAYAKGSGDENRVAGTIKAINRWVIATGFLGAVVTIALSPWLSEWIFESDAYVTAFILLSCVVFLMGIYSANYATLQGTRNLKLMAQANVFGAISGFLCSLPMFYFFRDEGIVWALILTALSTTAVSLFYVKKAYIPKVDQTFAESYRIGLKAVRLGIMLALSGISVTLVQFAIKTFIVRMGGLNDVGLYEAGWALNTTYLGLVFTAMAKDYYPRLSQIAGDNAQVKVMMSQQTEIALVLLAPLIIIMIVFMSFFIRLLYSSEFLAIVPRTKWLLIGALVRAGAWGTSFVFLAKGDGKLFLFNELGIKIITLPSYLLCYYWFGLVGIGYANVFNFLIYFLWVGIVAYRKYKISYSPIFWKLFITFLSIILLYPIGEQLWNAKYLTGIAITLCICGLSLYEFNKRIDIRDFWANIVSRFKSNKQ